MTERQRMQNALNFVRSETSDDLKEIVRLTREVEARSKATFILIKNLQAENQQLNEKVTNYSIQLAKLVVAIQQLTEAPENIHEAEAVVKDFLRGLHKK